MTEYLSSEIFSIVSDVAQQMNIKCYVIGGFVRDCFLGRPSKDIDIVVQGSGIDFAKAVSRRTHSKVSIFRTFGTAMLRYKGEEIEFVGARKESYNRDSRNPIVEAGSLEDDQKRRDFTINAMAFSLCKEDFGALVDPFGGIRDLDKGIIRTPLDPDKTYSDDPLRMMRAIRFACKLSTDERQFVIEQESLDSIKRNAYRLDIITKERIIEEMNKILVTAHPSIGLRLLQDTGLLERFLPCVSRLENIEVLDGKGHKDNFSHTLGVMDNLASCLTAEQREEKLFLMWAALLHDIGKPASKRFDPALGWTFHGHEIIGSRMIPKVFIGLKLPLDERMKYVQKLVQLHMRPIALTGEVTDSAVRRLLFEAGEDIDDLMLLCNADITSKNPHKVADRRANFEKVKEKMAIVEKKDELRNFKNPISGDYVMQVYNIPPCNTIGIIKEYIKDAILDGVIPCEFEAADRLMRQKALELGLEERK